MLFHVTLKDFSRGHNKEGIYWKIGAWGTGTQTMSGIISPGLSHFHHLTLKDLNQKKGKWSQFIIAKGCNHPKSFSFSAKYTRESYYNNCTCSIMKTGIRCCNGGNRSSSLIFFPRMNRSALLCRLFKDRYQTIVWNLRQPMSSTCSKTPTSFWEWSRLVLRGAGVDEEEAFVSPPLPPSPHFPSTTHLKSFLHFCRGKILSFERSNKQNELGEGCKIVYSQLSQHGMLK